MSEYVHGYSEDEAVRLADQSSTLVGLLHHDTCYPPGSRVLEVGCGVGAQTVFLARNSPDAEITSIDISPESVNKARASVRDAGMHNVTFQVADLFRMPFVDGSYDHVFVCFVLEHLPRPADALRSLKSLLRPGGSITVIEGDHGSYYSHPHSEAACLVVRCLIDVQSRMGGNALVGRELYHLLGSAGYSEVRVSPRMVYVDARFPELVDGFIDKTFTAMVKGVREQALSLGLVDERTWDKGIADLYRSMEPDGSFCYTFFKGVATKAGAEGRSGFPGEGTF
ncbi:MAG: class I SAM-dependent methyltransferase [Thermodesulfobacteriota bacterium]